MLFKRIFAATVAAALTFSTASFAQETPVFSLELNGATETEAGSCRLTYVAANRTGNALDRTAYEVAVFDSQGAVTRLLVLEFGDLIEGKTKILQFDLAGTPCGAISRIVVNDAAACVVAGSEAPICMQALTASSRTAIQFGI
ncbi:hypothetical protein [Sulfitobacter pacificus]|uniref:Tat pathway signal sequence domain protein n=1 Tax=Sulfitobacter pacificus TaxID=1499314 RepID=A0ABQ5VQD5_9RHOB|nr:hypothetical protein [Sulfitobacter pacificus]GLQ29432.1 hypothetical protein GCM10007927_42360 [Sulfitobacter pacificus]